MHIHLTIVLAQEKYPSKYADFIAPVALKLNSSITDKFVLRNTRSSILSGSSLILFDVTVFPAEDNTRSDFAEETGIQNTALANWERIGNEFSLAVQYVRTGRSVFAIGSSIYLLISFNTLVEESFVLSRKGKKFYFSILVLGHFGGIWGHFWAILGVKNRKKIEKIFLTRINPEWSETHFKPKFSRKFFSVSFKILKMAT